MNATYSTINNRHIGAMLLLIVGTGSMLLPTAKAGGPGAPITPLTNPFYTFDLQSPNVQNGTIAADAILFKEFPNPAPPSTLFPGDRLGLGQAGDEINGLSMANETITTNTPFILLFSVDRNTVGSTPPDAALTALRVPYNVQDQALKGQASGDQFMSLRLFSRQGIMPLNRAGNNNTQTRNNYNQGGTDFNADPPVGSGSPARRAAQDNVSGMVRSSIDLATAPLTSVYFSLAAGSPSLQTIPGAPPSGANIYFHPNPADIAAAPRLFAAADNLGLVAGDDINGMIVFDENSNGIFDGTDQVIFSLTAGSPSLTTIEPGLVGAPADTYSVLSAPTPILSLFAPASALGIEGATDNIDALDYSPCTNVDFCAEQHGIRNDIAPAVSQWGLIVIALMILCAGTVLTARRKSLSTS